MVSSRKIKNTIKLLINSDRTNFKVLDSNGTHKHAIYFEVVDNITGLEYYMKCSHPNNEKRMKMYAERPYFLKNEYGINKHVEEMHGDRPLILDKYHLTVSERADFDLEDYLNDEFFEAVPSKDERLTIFLHNVLGLKFLHDNGIVHKDVKTSNSLGYEGGKLWKVSDLCTISPIDPESGVLISRSFAGVEQFMSPEAIQKHGFNKNLPSDRQHEKIPMEKILDKKNEIYSIHAVKFVIDFPEHLTPTQLFGVNYPFDEAKRFIEASSLDKVSKYLLIRGLSHEKPKELKTTQMNMHDYRFEDLSEPEKIIRTGTIPKSHASYQSNSKEFSRFKSEGYKLNDYVTKIEKGLDDEGMPVRKDFKTVEEMVDTYERFDEFSKHKTVVNNPEKNEILDEVLHKYRTLREEMGENIFKYKEELVKINEENKDKEKKDKTTITPEMMGKLARYFDVAYLLGPGWGIGYTKETEKYKRRLSVSELDKNHIRLKYNRIAGYENI